MDTHLKGTTVLIIEPDIDSALDLQDHLANEGANVVTAYRKERALDLVQRARLMGVVIESSVYEQDAELRVRLRERNIPHVVHRRAKPISSVIAELCAIVNPSVNAANARVARASVRSRVAGPFGSASH